MRVSSENTFHPPPHPLPLREGDGGGVIFILLCDGYRHVSFIWSRFSFLLSKEPLFGPLSFRGFQDTPPLNMNFIRVPEVDIQKLLFDVLFV